LRAEIDALERVEADLARLREEYDALSRQRADIDRQIGDLMAT
jgi:cell division protein FtsB